MERFTHAEKADMHFIYGAAGGNGRLALRMYRERFPRREVPDYRYFATLHTRLRDTGSFNVNRGNAGRGRHPQEDRIVEYFEQHPRTSTRAAAQRLGLRNHTTVWRAVHRQQLHPYHFQRVQGLMPRDFEPRMLFCQWLMQQERIQRGFSKRILFTDEVNFCRDGAFNLHNNHYWAANNPSVIHPNSHQHRFSVNVWAGIIGNNLIGPYLLPSPLTGHAYTIFLREVLPGLLEDVPLETRRRMWFQHDGAPAHYFGETRLFLNNQFQNRWIGRGGPVAWPARSPDLTPLDFFLWGTMKDLVYATPVESEQDLVGRIVDSAGRITEMPGVFQSVRRSLADRCRKCVEVHGGHFEQLL